MCVVRWELCARALQGGRSTQCEKVRGNQLRGIGATSCLPLLFFQDSLFSSTFFNPLNPCEVLFPSETLSPGCSLPPLQSISFPPNPDYSSPTSNQAGSERLGNSAPAAHQVPLLPLTALQRHLLYGCALLTGVLLTPSLLTKTTSSRVYH